LDIKSRHLNFSALRKSIQYRVHRDHRERKFEIS
jgi:hypothetical protein